MKHMLLAAAISLSLHVMFLGADLRRFIDPARKTIENQGIVVKLTSRETVRARSHNTQTPDEDKSAQKPQPKSVTSPEQKSAPRISDKVSKQTLLADNKKQKNKVLEVSDSEDSPINNQPTPAIPSSQSEQDDTTPNPSIDAGFEQTVLASEATSVMSSNSTGKAQDHVGQTGIQKAVPIYKSNPAPRYPSIARRRGITGTVILSVLVKQNGKVGELSVHTSSGHSVLDKNAMQAVKQWAFKPGMQGKTIVSMRVLVPVSYTLK